MGAYCRVYDSCHLQADCQELVAGAPATKPLPPVIYSEVGVGHLHVTESTGTDLK